MKVSVIIPAYNEEKRIKKTLETVSEYMEKTFPDYEVLVVDDGSKDKTCQVVLPFLNDKIRLLSYGENRGKGAAVKYGILNSSGDFVAFTDADLPYPIENIQKALDLLKKENCDFVLGARVLKGGEKKYPLTRRIMSKVFSYMVRFIIGLNVPDTQCGFKVFSRECASDIFSKTTINGWGFDVEAIFIAVKYGYSFKRLNVELFHDINGSKISAVRDSFNMLSELKKIKKNDRKKLYD